MSTVQQKSKVTKPKKKVFLHKISLLSGWIFIFLLLAAFFNPQFFSDFEPLTIRLITLLLPPIVFLVSWNTQGFLPSLKWIAGLLWFPFSTAWLCLSSSRKLASSTWKWYSKISSKILLFVFTIAVCSVGVASENPLVLNILSYLAVMGIVVAILRISEKAFNPLGTVGRVVDAFIGLKQNVVFQMIVSFFSKKNTAEASTAETEKNLDRVITILGVVFKAPQWIENPRLPLVLFIANLIPVVTFTIILFGILIKSKLIGTSMASSLTNSDYFLMSLYQFTGSNFHSLPELPASISWTLGVEALVKFYYEVVLILAFGLTVQAQTTNLSKRFATHLNQKFGEAIKALPGHLQETHSKEERDVIQRRLSEKIELDGAGVDLTLQSDIAKSSSKKQNPELEEVQTSM